MSSALAGGRCAQNRPVEIGRMEIRLSSPHLADLPLCERRNSDDDSIDTLDRADNGLARFEITRRHLHGMREVFACRRGVSGEDPHRRAIGYETSRREMPGLLENVVSIKKACFTPLVGIYPATNL